jgi:iron complex transport system ATP-binding protein
MILDIDGIEFGYGSENTVSDITFSAGASDIVSILGPNGVGKTTLLRCINRIQSPRGGCVEIDGKDIASMSRRDVAREVGYVPQRGQVSGSTVFESVLIGRRPHIDQNISEADLRITGRAINLLGLTPISERPVDQISGGEYQMVQIARALAQHPRVILLDEPTSSLDLHNQHRVMRAIRSVVRSNGMCAVMTDHDLNLALRYSTRFILMAKGRIFAAGGREVITPENIKAIYGTDVYVGDLNGIPVVVAK